MTTTLRSLPAIKPRSRLIAEFAKFDVESFDKLDDYAMALSHADTVVEAAAPDAVKFDALLQSCIKWRDVTDADLRRAVARGHINGERMKELQGGNGYRNVAHDLFILVQIARTDWPKLEGKTFMTKAELDRSERAAEDLTAAIAAHLGAERNYLAVHVDDVTRGELVTGEHSGLRRTPQEPSDNPNLITALNARSIAWVGSDNSREPEQRNVGNAATVPRYPMNIFYNVGTRAEEVDEYNWIYTSAAEGGSGICEDNPTSTCIPPLDSATGFESYIVPFEARLALVHALANNAKPHYVHQSNLAEDRILYPVLDLMLGDYRALWAANSPLVNPTMTHSGTEIRQQKQWLNDRRFISAYVQSGRLYLTTSAGLFSETTTPVSLPSAASASSLGVYGTERTGWTQVSGFLGASYTLPTSVGYPR